METDEGVQAMHDGAGIPDLHKGCY
jgi:hypothetical protein